MFVDIKKKSNILTNFNRVKNLFVLYIISKLINSLKFFKSEVFLEISKTVIISIFYGLLLSFSFNILFNINFGIQTILSFSIIWYFIEAKLPFVINSYRGVNQ